MTTSNTYSQSIIIVPLSLFVGLCLYHFLLTARLVPAAMYLSNLEQGTILFMILPVVIGYGIARSAIPYWVKITIVLMASVPLISLGMLSYVDIKSCEAAGGYKCPLVHDTIIWLFGFPGFFLLSGFFLTHISRQFPTNVLVALGITLALWPLLLLDYNALISGPGPHWELYNPQ